MPARLRACARFLALPLELLLLGTSFACATPPRRLPGPPAGCVFAYTDYSDGPGYARPVYRCPAR